MNKTARYLLVPCLSLLSPGAAAQEPTLAVGVREAPPFSSRAPGGDWTGLAVELWKRVAADVGFTTDWQETPLDRTLERLAGGGLDAAAAALTITASREERIDFTVPFLSGGLGMAVRGQRETGVNAVVDRVFSVELLQAIGALALILLVCGTVVWWLEHRANPEHFGGKGLRGIGSGFWFSAVTMTTVGYGDKAPRTFAGRAVSLVWMFASIIVISSYTAAIASALTADRLGSALDGPEDLATARVVTVEGSAAADWLREQNLVFGTVTGPAEAVDAVAAGEADAVVYDQPILQHLTRPVGNVVVLPQVLRHEQYAFGLPQGSEWRERINRALLQQLDSAEWAVMLERTLGGGS